MSRFVARHTCLQRGCPGRWMPSPMRRGRPLDCRMMRTTRLALQSVEVRFRLRPFPYRAPLANTQPGSQISGSERTLRGGTPDNAAYPPAVSVPHHLNASCFRAPTPPVSRPQAPLSTAPSSSPTAAVECTGTRPPLRREMGPPRRLDAHRAGRGDRARGSQRERQEHADARDLDRTQPDARDRLGVRS